MKMENFLGTKSWSEILERLKQKVDIFIRTKNIFNPKLFKSILYNIILYYHHT